VVHDERGIASLEWTDAPENYERPAFSVGGTGVKDPLSIKKEESFNPYDRSPDSAPAKDPAPRGGKRDLKKLSAWLKMMREMEERKKRGEE
jgi:hypothetical protein